MLTEQKKQFADNYLVCFNATEAARNSGYKHKRAGALRIKAYKLLKDGDVAKYIKQRLQEKEEADIAKSTEIIKFLTNCLRGGETEKMYFVLRSGTTGKDGSYDDELIYKDVPIKLKDRLKAAELLAKINKMMDGNVDQRTQKVVINYNIPEKNIELDNDE